MTVLGRRPGRRALRDVRWPPPTAVDAPGPPRRQRSRLPRAARRGTRAASPATSSSSPFFILFGVFGLFPHRVHAAGSRCTTGACWPASDELDRAWPTTRSCCPTTDFWNALVNTLGIFLLATVPQLLARARPGPAAQPAAARRAPSGGWACCCRTSPRSPRSASSSRCSSPATSAWSTGCSASSASSPIDWQDHRWSSWLAISMMVDWRWTGYNALIFLAAMQAIPKDLYEAAAIDGASAVAAVLAASPCRCSGRRSSSSSLISTIGGIQLFTEPLLFNSGANAITGGTTRQFQTLTMYLYEQAFTGHRLRLRRGDRLGRCSWSSRSSAASTRCCCGALDGSAD